MTQTTHRVGKTERAAYRPAHTIRYGAIRAAIWRNIIDNGNASGPLYCVTFSRSYKDNSDHWKDTNSFGRDDLLALAKVADEAHTWIYRQREDSDRAKL